MHPAYKEENVTTELAKIVHNWVNKKIPGYLQLIIAFQAEEAPLAASCFKAADKTLNTHV